jgi:hypothetical protein
MPATRPAKPIIKVYLLPAWNEDQFQACFNRLVNAAKSIAALHVNSEDDIIILFSQDAMVYGLGTEIVIEVDLPQSLVVDTAEQETADAMFAVMQGFLPKAYIQCKVYAFDTSRGYRATGVNRE